jgi:hypothetical protein
MTSTTPGVFPIASSETNANRESDETATPWTTLARVEISRAPGRGDVEDRNRLPAFVAGDELSVAAHSEV